MKERSSQSVNHSSTGADQTAAISNAVISTPYKYNGGQLYINSHNQEKSASEVGELEKAKYTISIDWLEATFSGRFLHLREYEEPRDVLEFGYSGVAMMRDIARWNGTKHYKYAYRMILNGEEIGTILTHPRAKILDRNLSQMRIDNHVLYQKGAIDQMLYVADTIAVTMNNLTRLDIAIDGVNFISDYSNVIQGKYKKIGRAKMATEHQPNGDVEGFYIGRRSSEKFLRGYNKTKELVQASNSKDYIKQFWERNNLDMTRGDIERLEIVMKAKAIKRIKDFDLNQLDKPSYLAGIMRTEFAGWYQFIDAKDKTKNVSRKEKIEAIDWDYFKPTDLEKERKTNKPNVIWAVQRAVTFEMQEFFAGKEVMSDDLFGQVYAKCFTRCERYGILDWFQRKMPYWSKDREYHAEIRAKLEEVERRAGISNKGHFSVSKFMEM